MEEQTDTGWAAGEACPHCGCSRITVTVEHELEYRSENGNYIFIQQTDYIGDETNPMCVECERFL